MNCQQLWAGQSYELLAAGRRRRRAKGAPKRRRIMRDKNPALVHDGAPGRLRNLPDAVTSIVRNLTRSRAPGAGTLGNLRPRPQRGVDRRLVRDQVGYLRRDHDDVGARSESLDLFFRGPEVRNPNVCIPNEVRRRQPP